MKSYIILLIATLSIVACNTKEAQNENNEEVAASTEPVQNINPVKVDKEGLKKLMAENPDVQLVDVRTVNETDLGHIEGALIGMDFLSGEFKNRMNSIDKEKPVVVYCAKGGRSAKAAQELVDNGYTVVYDYSGGYTDWSADQ
ncbi:rhodanese-like domain-containing protein [Fulvivirga sp. RKSG066]|uniref:rhodanese-like domain-containing protein n=1 Tax=Fulvivirga aurantia TaxID=2529383 RepID=UPI0012BCD58C|nr:rhodanese-like domain-containing protein [Fulvivirga aurantia]MTI22532.1 rhodanese-like domain-containing protein [Fulvivirga aurantia]